jgi:hypothetical protein
MKQCSVSRLCLLIVTGVILTGCVGYRLGSMLPPDIKTVHVPTFINNTEEPLLEIAATRAAIQEIQRDGSLKIAPEETADSILTVRLTRFRLEALEYDRERRAAADEYRAYLTASMQLVRRGSGDVIAASENIEGDATFLLTGDLTSAKESVFPEVSEDLAQRLVSRMVETW